MGTIAVLVSLLLPALAGAREQSRAAQCLSNLRQQAIGFEIYTQWSGGDYPAAQDPVSKTPHYWLWMGRGLRDTIRPALDHTMGRTNPGVLACPSDPTPADTFDKTSYAYSMAFYHSPEQINAMTRTDATFSDPRPPRAQSPSDVLFPADKIITGEWASYHEPVPDDAGWWDRRGARQFLFPDGHAERIDAQRIAPANDGLPHPNLTADGIRGRDRG